jgi:hypothetical protein
MLIRIAPEMFTNERYECVTVRKVYEEFTRNQKFKTKYPWRNVFRSKIKSLGATIEESESVMRNFKLISNLIDTDTVVNQSSRSFFDLSRADRYIAACAVTYHYDVSTVDGDLTDLLKQEFKTNIIKPLGLINQWLEKGLISWNDEKQSVLEDWCVCNEAAQDRADIDKFRRLTRRKYPCP